MIIPCSAENNVQKSQMEWDDWIERLRNELCLHQRGDDDKSLTGIINDYFIIG